MGSFGQHRVTTILWNLRVGAPIVISVVWLWESRCVWCLLSQKVEMCPLELRRPGIWDSSSIDLVELERSLKLLPQSSNGAAFSLTDLVLPCLKVRHSFSPEVFPTPLEYMICLPKKLIYSCPLRNSPGCWCHCIQEEKSCQLLVLQNRSL